MTPQEIFNKSVRHMRQQGERALKGDSCQYLAPDGRKCAVGCLIDNPLLARDMDALSDSSITAVLRIPEMTERLPEWMVNNEELLSRLQEVHDDYLEPGGTDFEEAVRDVASTFDLEVPS